jgi:ABC-2 type transport system ATP-binding protein
MDEAERCHRLAYISYGNLLTHGTVAEVIKHVGLTTYSVKGPNLLDLAEKLRATKGVQQAVAFGTDLHVSGENKEELDQAIAPFRKEPYEWNQIRSGLEDAFIHLMENSKDNFAAPA